MFEHFEEDVQELYQIKTNEMPELEEIAYQLVGIEVPSPEEIEKPVSINSAMVGGLAMMMFRAGRSYQADIEDGEATTIRIPKGKEGRIIEGLIGLLGEE